MSHQKKQDSNKSDDLLQTILSLSSQSNESCNIILQAILRGLSTGISQGITSGNISVSFQDIISLASNFKPSEEIPLQLTIQKFSEEQRFSSLTKNHRNESSPIKVLANPGSHIITVKPHLDIHQLFTFLMLPLRVTRLTSFRYLNGCQKLQTMETRKAHVYPLIQLWILEVILL
jgi:hypothetical protein